MRAEVCFSSEADEFETAERCHILEVANDDGDPSVSISRARVLAGVTTAWHLLHNTEERYIVISGEGTMEMGQLPPVNVTPGAVVRIPRNTAQRITNTGDEDLVFYCVCTPRFRRDCYEECDPAPAPDA